MAENLNLLITFSESLSCRIKTKFVQSFGADRTDKQRERRKDVMLLRLQLSWVHIKFAPSNLCYVRETYENREEISIKFVNI